MDRCREGPQLHLFGAIDILRVRLFPLGRRRDVFVGVHEQVERAWGRHGAPHVRGRRSALVGQIHRRVGPHLQQAAFGAAGPRRRNGVHCRSRIGKNVTLAVIWRMMAPISLWISRSDLVTGLAKVLASAQTHPPTPRRPARTHAQWRQHQPSPRQSTSGRSDAALDVLTRHPPAALPPAGQTATARASRSCPSP